MGNHIGYTLEIAVGRPATEDKAGYEALTFTEVFGFGSVPKDRFSTSDIETPDLHTGVNIANKGMATGQDQTISFHKSLSIVGQSNVIDAAAVTQADEITWRVGRQTGIDEVEYLCGILRNYLPKEGNGDNDDGFEVSFRQNSAGLVTTRPSV